MCGKDRGGPWSEKSSRISRLPADIDGEKLWPDMAVRSSENYLMNSESSDDSIILPSRL